VFHCTILCVCSIVECLCVKLNWWFGIDFFHHWEEHVIKRSVLKFEVGLLDMNGVFIVKVSNQVVSTYLHLKVRRQEDQKNWTVKHNLCYWMSNRLQITTDFYKLQWTPKFTDNQRITDTDTCIFVSIFMHICIHSLHRCCTRFGSYPNYILVYIKMFVKTTCKCFLKKTAHIGVNARAGIFNAGLLARSQFASRRSCDQPTWSRFCTSFLGPRANAESVPKFHTVLHALHANLPMVTLKILP
jgi:hypothetical protein